MTHVGIRAQAPRLGRTKTTLSKDIVEIETKVKVNEKSLLEARKEIKALNIQLKDQAKSLEKGQRELEQQKRKSEHSLREKQATQMLNRKLEGELSKLKFLVNNRDLELQTKEKRINGLVIKVEELEIKLSAAMATSGLGRYGLRSGVNLNRSSSRFDSRSSLGVTLPRPPSRSTFTKSSTPIIHTAIRAATVEKTRIEQLSKDNETLKNRIKELEKEKERISLKHLSATLPLPATGKSPRITISPPQTPSTPSRIPPPTSIKQLTTKRTIATRKSSVTSKTRAKSPGTSLPKSVTSISTVYTPKKVVTVSTPKKVVATSTPKKPVTKKPKISATLPPPKMDQPPTTYLSELLDIKEEKKELESAVQAKEHEIESIRKELDILLQTLKKEVAEKDFLFNQKKENQEELDSLKKQISISETDSKETEKDNEIDSLKDQLKFSQKKAQQHLLFNKIIKERAIEEWLFEKDQFMDDY